MWTPPTRRLPTRHIDDNIHTENTVDSGEHSGLWTMLRVDAFANLAQEPRFLTSTRLE